MTEHPYHFATWSMVTDLVQATESTDCHRQVREFQVLAYLANHLVGAKFPEFSDFEAIPLSHELEEILQEMIAWGHLADRQNGLRSTSEGREFADEHREEDVREKMVLFAQMISDLDLEELGLLAPALDSQRKQNDKLPRKVLDRADALRSKFAAHLTMA